ncbi:MFS transporter [Nocardia sp. NEAU-G5]|uniref:MFS transporter n=1 Tax=Nocardia albiluteola TaxID=2842303 RepID=A0ABS6AYA0_9NOCA|nr:MFS transporter [Nocardia albiluteola]MBU3063021.1 MFS transporter [Nocardia albiluteola]
MSSSTLQSPVAVPARATSDHASWGTLLVLLAGIFMATLDFFIVNVAIPGTQADLHASSAAMQWVVAGYGLAVAAGLITGGRLGDMFGRRRMYGLGMALFTVASIVCAMAGGAGELIAARVVQGVGMALVTPQVLGIISVVFAGARQARAFAAYGLTMGLAAVFGQLIGGALIQADLFGLGWRTIYWINVPVGVIALAVLRRSVPESRGNAGTRLDPYGVGLILAALVALVLPLIQGRTQGWPLWTWLSLATAAVLLGVFAWYQRRLAARGAAPLVDPTLFRDRAFSVGVVLSLAYQMTMGSFFLFLALYLQQGRGMTPLSSGALFLSIGGPYMLTSSVAERLAARLGRQVIALGAMMQGAGLVLLAVAAERAGGQVALEWLLPGLVIAGAGMGLALVPVPGVVLAGVAPEHAAAAGGVLATAQQVGGALGIAVVGIVFYDRLGGTGNPGPAFVASLVPMSLLCLITAGLVQLLPRSRRKS